MTITNDDSGAARESDTVSRRQFMHNLLAASIAASAAGSLVGGAIAEAGAFRLPASTRDLLTTVLNHIIPPDVRMPGAGDAGLSAFVERAMIASPIIRQRLTTLVEALPASPAFETLAVDEAVAVLRALEQTHPEAFDTLIETTYTGYYGHPQVLARLGLGPQDLDYLLDRFDPELLDKINQHTFSAPRSM